VLVSGQIGLHMQCSLITPQEDLNFHSVRMTVPICTHHLIVEVEPAFCPIIRMLEQ